VLIGGYSFEEEVKALLADIDVVGVLAALPTPISTAIFF